jgi:two-component system, chemotaxis family, sensor kinase CheA
MPMDRAQLAARLMATFVGELDEQVQVMNGDILALESNPRDAEHVKSLFRVAHTLKGAARASAVPVIEQACHELETLLAEVRDGARTLGPADVTLLFSSADALADAGRRLRAGDDLARAPIAGIRDAVRARQKRRTDAPTGDDHASAAERPRVARQPVPAPQPEPNPHDAPVRVQGDKLDAVLASTEQLLIAGSGIASRPAELAMLRDFTASWATEWARARRRLVRALERADVPESVRHSLGRIDENLRHVVHETNVLATRSATEAQALAQMTAELSERVRRLRMRPVADAWEALPRAARDVAAASGKEVRFEIVGGDVQADTGILDGLREAVLHLVRNAIDHGIEEPAARNTAGKPRVGSVTVATAMRGDRIVVTVTDDGAGLDTRAIRDQLERQGVPAPALDRDLIHALFQGGVSTRRETTAISGRGVGLDIVRAAAGRIRGRLDVTWEAGRGTTFSLECPPTLASLRALLVSVGGQLIAIPTLHVARLLRLPAASIRNIEGREVLVTSDGPLPLLALARLLPPFVERPIGEIAAVVILMVGDRRVAIVVDELVAEQEIVLRPLNVGEQPLPYVSGATLLGTGKVALVLDAPAIADAASRYVDAAGLTFAKPTGAAPERRRVLVVDDSITTRTLEQSVLEAAGYDVVTAADGAAGWATLQESGADLVVADIEMPRMDGIALCEAIRASARFKAVPVVLVTALETPEHRTRGLDVGADAYLAKSSFDQQNLLDTISQLLG